MRRAKKNEIKRKYLLRSARYVVQLETMNTLYVVEAESGVHPGAHLPARKGGSFPDDCTSPMETHPGHHRGR